MNVLKKMAKVTCKAMFGLLILVLSPALALASEADLKIPELAPEQNSLLLMGIGICVLGLLFGFYQW